MPSVPKVPLDPELQKLVDESVERFKKRWGVMIGFAEAGGHIEAYRKEVEALVRTVSEHVATNAKNSDTAGQ